MLENVIDIMKLKAIEAGEIIMEIYNSEFSVELKADNSPLTQADKMANEVIVSALREKFPEWAILSEEEKDNEERLSNDYCFIVDPLDGTKEFINRNGQFTVNIALSHLHHVIAGVIYVPVTKELYYAEKGCGSFLKNIETMEVSQIKVSDKTENLIWVGSKSHSSEKERALIKQKETVISDIKTAGSSLKGCMVARGEADIYYRFGYTCEWDTAAMQAIVEEAGGIFKQMDNSEMLYNRENNLNEKGFYIVNRSQNIWV